MRGVEGNPVQTAIVSATVVLAKGLEVDVFAEGVETESDLERIQALGVEKVQGYWFAEPMPAEDVEDWVRSFCEGSW